MPYLLPPHLVWRESEVSISSLVALCGYSIFLKWKHASISYPFFIMGVTVGSRFWRHGGTFPFPMPLASFFLPFCLFPSHAMSYLAQADRWSGRSHTPLPCHLPYFRFPSRTRMTDKTFLPALFRQLRDHLHFYSFYKHDMWWFLSLSCILHFSCIFLSLHFWTSSLGWEQGFPGQQPSLYHPSPLLLSLQLPTTKLRLLLPFISLHRTGGTFGTFWSGRLNRKGIVRTRLGGGGGCSLSIFYPPDGDSVCMWWLLCMPPPALPVAMPSLPNFTACNFSLPPWAGRQWLSNQKEKKAQG